VDNAAHVGGLITGFIAAFVLGGGKLFETPLRRIGLPTIITVIGGALFSGLAMSSGNADLTDIRDDVQAERNSAAEAHQATQLKAQARQAAVKEQADIDRMVQEDARRRPAPVSDEEAAGKTIELGVYPTDFVIGASGRNADVTDLGDNTLRVVDWPSARVTKHSMP